MIQIVSELQKNCLWHLPQITQTIFSKIDFQTLGDVYFYICVCSEKNIPPYSGFPPAGIQPLWTSKTPRWKIRETKVSSATNLLVSPARSISLMALEKTQGTRVGWDKKTWPVDPPLCGVYCFRFSANFGMKVIYSKWTPPKNPPALAAYSSSLSVCFGDLPRTILLKKIITLGFCPQLLADEDPIPLTEHVRILISRGPRNKPWHCIRPEGLRKTTPNCSPKQCQNDWFAGLRWAPEIFFAGWIFASLNLRRVL